MKSKHIPKDYNLTLRADYVPKGFYEDLKGRLSRAGIAAVRICTEPNGKKALKNAGIIFTVPLGGVPSIIYLAINTAYRYARESKRKRDERNRKEGKIVMILEEAEK